MAKTLKVVGGIVFVSIAAYVIFSALPGAMQPARAQEGNALSGTATVPAGGVLVIIGADPGELISGHVTTRGDAEHYDLQTKVEGATTHLTGSPPSATPATRQQNADFVGENLEIHNFSTTNPVTIQFAVAFQEVRPVRRR